MYSTYKLNTVRISKFYTASLCFIFLPLFIHQSVFNLCLLISEPLVWFVRAPESGPLLGPQLGLLPTDNTAWSAGYHHVLPQTPALTHRRIANYYRTSCKLTKERCHRIPKMSCLKHYSPFDITVICLLYALSQSINHSLI